MVSKERGEAEEGYSGGGRRDWVSAVGTKADTDEACCQVSCFSRSCPEPMPSPRDHGLPVPCSSGILVYLILKGILAIDLWLPRAGARLGKPFLSPSPAKVGLF